MQPDLKITMINRTEAMLTVLRSAKLDLRLDLAVFSLDGAAKKGQSEKRRTKICRIPGQTAWQSLGPFNCKSWVR